MSQAAELTGVRSFQLIDREISDPGPGEVQVRVAAIGICGSDIHAYSEGGVGDAKNRYPMVLGHEPSGVVVKTGTGVTGWAAGDAAALEPALYCYHCEYCMSGHHNVCANIRFMSSIDDPGFFRERVNVPARNLLGLAPGTGLKEATLVEPLSIALHSLTFAPVQLGDQILVFGAGPIGLLTIACLKLAGASRIWAVDPVAHRRELALHIGADAAIDPHGSDVASEVMRDTGQRGADAVYDCAAKGDTVNQAMRAARNRAPIIMTGIHSEVEVAWNVHVMRRKELSIFSVRRSNHESELARDLLSSHAKRFAAIITHERPMDRITEGFDTVEKYADGVGKLLIVPS